MTKLILALMLLQGYHLPTETIEATAYCPCIKCNGVSHNIAKNGEELLPGWSIAVDPEKIPLNSLIYIKGVGFRKAVDTGSAIKGERIDILFDTHENALQFGRKNVDYLVLRSGKNATLQTN